MSSLHELSQVRDSNSIPKSDLKVSRSSHSSHGVLLGALGGGVIVCFTFPSSPTSSLLTWAKKALLPWELPPRSNQSQWQLKSNLQKGGSRRAVLEVFLLSWRGGAQPLFRQSYAKILWFDLKGCVWNESFVDSNMYTCSVAPMLLPGSCCSICSRWRNNETPDLKLGVLPPQVPEDIALFSRGAPC